LRWPLALASACVLPFAGGCVVGDAFTRPATVAGSLTFESPGSPVQSLRPSACRSGHESYFLGADLWSPDESPRVRIVIDPVEGPLVRVTRSGQTNLYVPGTCEYLDASAEWTGWTVNDVREVRGQLQLDCTLPSGERVHGDLQFAGCH
jgi:hypothetical protein